MIICLGVKNLFIFKIIFLYSLIGIQKIINSDSLIESCKLLPKTAGNFNLFIFGGVNYEPYKAKFENLIGRSVDSIELYPASEGFFAFQDRQNKEGMLLQLDSGIFYEFIEASEFFEASPKRRTPPVKC